MLDRSFYSEGNVDTLFEKCYQFDPMVRTDRVWVRDINDKFYKQVAISEYYRQTCEGEVL